MKVLRLLRTWLKINKESDVYDIYIQGFMDKCAACGVDPLELVKYAAGSSPLPPEPRSGTDPSAVGRGEVAPVAPEGKAPKQPPKGPPPTGRLQHIQAMTKIKTDKLQKR